MNETDGLIERYSSWERFAWEHPEWWTLALSVVAWLVMIVQFNSATEISSSHWAHHGSMHGRSMPWIGETYWWLIMVTAMMLPLVVDSIRITAARSLWTRRHRAICAFIFGYVGVWVTAGMVIFAVVPSLRLHEWFHPPVAVGPAFGVAALWQLTPLKQRALQSCHRTTPIAPRGWRADRDCIRYGSMIGASCVASCWALMVACSLTGHSIAAMACVSSVEIAERYMMRPNQRAISGAIAAFAVLYLIDRLY